MSIPSPFWAPDRHADRRPRLLARARAMAAIRAYFGSHGFVEVETAALQVSPGNETHLHGFATELIAGDGAPHQAYLHTSPEFAMKKLLAGGETRIFSFARVFRNRERTALHAPEFTMLEWYRVGEGLDAMMTDCAALMRITAEAAGAGRLRFRGREADPFAEAERISVRDAFLRHAGVDLFDSLQAPSAVASEAPSPLAGEGGRRPDEGSAPRLVGHSFANTGAVSLEASRALENESGVDVRGDPSSPLRGPSPARGEGANRRPCIVPDRAKLAAALFAKDLRVAADDSWSDLFSRLLSEKVEPNLGLGRPTFLTEYPATKAALARLSPHDPRVAERFELYACGVELANAFGELTDPDEQRRRFEEDMALKARIYGERYPIDEDFLACLPYLKPCSGVALGFDRLVMLACGADSLEDVQWTPVFRP